MRHKLNVLDSSIRFGEKMKWSRVFKYQERGLGCNLPMHIRLHGHGGLGKHTTHNTQHNIARSTARTARMAHNMAHTAHMQCLKRGGHVGQGWLERGVPQGGSLGQVYHLMAMAKLVLLKRHLVGDVFPQTGCGEYFMWSSRWPRGYDHCRVSCVVCRVVCRVCTALI